MKPMNPTEVRAAMSRVADWRRRGKTIHREFTFADFPPAIRFVNSVARAAEKANHHPDIDIRWNRVLLALTTHDAGGLTEKDCELAVRCDALAKKSGAKPCNHGGWPAARRHCRQVQDPPWRYAGTVRARAARPRPTCETPR